MRSVLFLVLFSFNAFASNEPPPGRSHLWQQPAQPVKRLDLFWGGGSNETRPVGPFQFVSENTNGTNPKIRVIDSRGVKWGVKFNSEVPAEIAASRFYWAAGYRSDETYLVTNGIVTGAKNLGRAGKYIDSQGRMKPARFARKRKGPDVVSIESYDIHWKWENNPFYDSKELSGLMILNVLIANFDTKSDNNTVQSIRYSNNRYENWYLVDDVGGTFGSGNSTLGRYSEWKLKDYETAPLLGNSIGGTLHLDHHGKNGKDFESIPMEHARWFYSLIGGLEQSQIEDAFRAALSEQRSVPLANASDEALVKGFARVFSQRLRSLGVAVGLVR